MRILFVEDNVNTARAVKVMLELRGYTVETAHDIAGAKACLTANSYDMLISDLRLPDGTGYDLLNMFPTSRKCIALSGFTAEADQKEALDKGFAAFINKPFRTEELISAIESLANS